ncbi:MAG: universal stress protein [Rhodospirillales bacterium]
MRQGRLLAEALRAAAADDLVVMGWSAGERLAPWSTNPPPAVVAQALTAAQARSVLLLHAGAPRTGSVLIAFDDGEAARHALALGAQLAELEDAPLEVVLLQGRIDEAEHWMEVISASLAESRPGVSFLHAPKAGLRTLTEIALHHRSRLLVLDAGRTLAEGEAGRRLLGRLFCSVLLVH